MKICLLTDGIYPLVIGGMQKHSAQLLRHFLKTGHQVTLVHCIIDSGVLPDKNRVISLLNIEQFAEALEVISLRFPKKARVPGHYIRESYLYSELCFNEIKNQIPHFDFIYAQGFCAWHLLKLKKKLGITIPVGVHFHGLNMFQVQPNFVGKLQSYLFKKPVLENLKLADVIFSYEGKFVQLFESLGLKNKIRIFQPIGVDAIIPSHEIKIANTIRKIIFIGRYERLKGLKELHEVIPNFSSSQIEFSFVGPIPENKQLHQKNCKYFGVVTDEKLNQLLKENDCVICPSYSEGMPYVVLEAIANGMVVIASDVGSISELVTEAKNGWLHSPGNKNEMKSAIEKFSNTSNEELMSMKNYSLQHAQKFTWDTIIPNTIEELKKVIVLKK